MPTKKQTKHSRKTKSSKKHPKHFAKVYWPYIPAIVLVLAGLLFTPLNPAHSSQNVGPQTLAYATEMSRTALLNGTNAQRVGNGVPALTINAQLNSSAQAKAQDMLTLDYWAHNSPNGDEPWVFFDAAGYVYAKAGENLAYGFNTSADTIIGWMNSPSHRANILDTAYTEVGFGFVNSENFVGSGQQTIVVAHYATPVSAPAPPPPAPTPAPVTTPTPTPATTPEPEPEPAVVEEPAAEEPVEEPEAPAETSNTPVTTETPVPTEAEPVTISRIQRLTRGLAPWSAAVVSVGAVSIAIVWLLRHAYLVKKFIRNGEHFVAHHPIIDIAVLAIIAGAIYLSQSSGVIL